MKFEQLKNELDNNIFRRVYIFTGPEKGVMFKYLKRVGVTNILQNFSEALPLMRGKTLFESGQVLAVREGFEEYEYQKLVDLCGNSHRLVLLPEVVDSRKKLYREGMPAVVEFLHFTSEQLCSYVRAQFPADFSLEMSLCQLIAARCNNDVLSIENACAKLVSLQEPLTKELVLELITPMPEDRIFDLAEEIVLGKASSVFSIISELYQLKTGELQMIVLIYNHFKTMLQIQHYSDKNDFELAKITGLSSYIVDKKRKSSAKIRSNDYYLRALRLLYRAEWDIKSGRVPAEPCFFQLIFELLKK